VFSTPKIDAKVCQTFNAYSSTTYIKVNKHSVQVIEKGRNGFLKFSNLF